MRLTLQGLEAVMKLEDLKLSPRFGGWRFGCWVTATWLGTINSVVILVNTRNLFTVAAVTS